jgi:hypothetical protein
MTQIIVWEVNSRSETEEISRHLSILKIHYCAYKRPPMDPILNRINPVHTFTIQFFKIYFHIPYSPIYA